MNWKIVLHCSIYFLLNSLSCNETAINWWEYIKTCTSNMFYKNNEYNNNKWYAEESEADFCALIVLRSVSFLCQSNTVSAPKSATVYARCRHIVCRRGTLTWTWVLSLPMLAFGHRWQIGAFASFAVLQRQDAIWSPQYVLWIMSVYWESWEVERVGVMQRICLQRERWMILNQAFFTPHNHENRMIPTRSTNSVFLINPINLIMYSTSV